jgi:polyribonucleotide nucleotidyltransferase
MGDTMLLATVVAKKDAAENVDFMPLSVEYREKYAAAGRFPEVSSKGKPVRRIMRS